MRKPIVCLSCEEIFKEECSMFWDEYKPIPLCYNVVEGYKLDEMGRLWLKNKHKFLHPYKEIKTNPTLRKWAKNRCAHYITGGKCPQKCNHQRLRHVCCAFCEQVEDCKKENKICSDLEYAEIDVK